MTITQYTSPVCLSTESKPGKGGQDSLFMEEIWIPTLSLPGYEVSDFGRIRSVSRSVKHCRGGTQKLTGRILRPFINKSGYVTITLCHNAKHKTYYIHRLVFFSFNPYSTDDCVDHIDEDKQNNFLSNLRGCSSAQNVRYYRGNRNDFVGVYPNGNGTKTFRARTRKGQKLIGLGTFKTKEEAHKVYLNYIENDKN